MPDAPRPAPEGERPAPRVPIITDPNTLERRARDLTDQNFRFRTWIKFECDLEDEELDALVRETADAVWAHIDCASCGRCCHLDSITVDDADVARLSQRLEMTPVAFRKRYVRQVDTEPAIAGGPCPFLRGKLCSVYADRPKSCADFPYLHSPGFSYRMLMLIQLSYVCPVVFNTLEALKRRLPWRGSRRRRGASGRHG